VTQNICKETGGILYQNQIGTFQAYGNIKIPFTKDEMKQIKTFDSQGIKLMGFKSIDSIKHYYNVRESYFIYPDENLTSGASQLCDALIKQLISKNKVAIVKFIPREGSNIRFCALIPQKEVFDEDYFQTPPGFNMIFLPYADEIRSNSDIFSKLKNKEGMKEAVEQVSQEPEYSDMAKKLIKKMNIEFDSRNFENPTIQKFYATLQALALGEQDIEPVVDYLTPNEKHYGKILKGCDEEFKNLFFGEGVDRNYKPEFKEKTGYKRKGAKRDRKSVV
jgi:ATP-dependent DNA helicase 2 subunit 1